MQSKQKHCLNLNSEIYIVPKKIKGEIKPVEEYSYHLTAQKHFKKITIYEAERVSDKKPEQFLPKRIEETVLLKKRDAVKRLEKLKRNKKRNQRIHNNKNKKTEK